MTVVTLTLNSWDNKKINKYIIMKRHNNINCMLRLSKLVAGIKWLMVKTSDKLLKDCAS